MAFPCKYPVRIIAYCYQQCFAFSECNVEAALRSPEQLSHATDRQCHGIFGTAARSSTSFFAAMSADFPLDREIAILPAQGQRMQGDVGTQLGRRSLPNFLKDSFALVHTSWVRETVPPRFLKPRPI